MKKNKNDVVRFRCADYEKELFEFMAQELGYKNLSEYIRSALLQQVHPNQLDKYYSAIGEGEK